jgi:hypothetical protein
MTPSPGKGGGKPPMNVKTIACVLVGAGLGYWISKKI